MKRWHICFWSGIEWFSVKSFPSIEQAGEFASTLNIKTLSGKRIHWKLMLLDCA